MKILDHEGFGKNSEKPWRTPLPRPCFAAYIEPTGAATGHLATEGATIRMTPTGKINVYVNGGSTGNSIETTVVQLTADALGADIDDVATIQGDTAVTPYGAGTQGSRSGPMTAGAVNEAGTMLRSQIVAIAAHYLGVAESDVELANSRAAVRDDPTRSVGFAELAYRAYYEPQQLPPGMSASLEAPRASPRRRRSTGQRHPRLHLRGRRGNRQVKLLRYIVSEDVAR
ncbi:molybdopterin-binding domain of aldehyde dehydrogenase family protein [Mycobacterium xenopi 3993]|nr:molybdopterin-binding domain of aldehyde dehydrogenase family protein [Mycobacterium xenopi 3993]